MAETTGDTGYTGYTGYVGPHGIYNYGYPGPTGPTGLQGVAGQQGPRGFPGIPTNPLGVAVFTALTQGGGDSYTIAADQTDFPINLFDFLGPGPNAPFGIPGLVFGNGSGGASGNIITIPAGTYYVEAAVNIGSSDFSSNDLNFSGKTLALFLDNGSGQQNICGMSTQPIAPTTVYLSSYLRVTATTNYTFHMKSDDKFHNQEKAYRWFSSPNLSTYSGQPTAVSNNLFQNSTIAFLKIA